MHLLDQMDAFRNQPINNIIPNFGKELMHLLDQMDAFWNQPINNIMPNFENLNLIH